MVRTLRYIFFFCLPFLTACTKNEFKLVFELASEITDNYNVIYYATDTNGGLTIQAVASVREGKCELKGVTKKPTLVYITARNSSYPLVVYVKKGSSIAISGDNMDPLSWKVGEGDINEELSKWRIDNLKILEGNQPEKVNTAVADYLNKYPGNPVSVILMQSYFNREINENKYVKLMASFEGEATDKEWRKILGRTDYVLTFNNYPARLESMILRSTNKSADTLMIDRKQPVFLLFWENGGSENQFITDSIKKLIKENSGVQPLIADVCLDIDSTTWRNTIRRDSLENIKRFWVPAGMADPTIMKFKVNSVPYFIVFDKEGVQSYRGTEIGDAMKQYRKLQKSK